MRRKKKLCVGIGAVKAALDRFEVVWKRAASQKLSEEEALQKGIEAKAVKFVKQGGRDL